jgi:hypothetical protein
MPDSNRKRTAEAREEHIAGGRVGRGCAFCGRSAPLLANLGLYESHIVKDIHKKENKVFLCASCSESFDRVLKPLIWNAVRLYAGGRVPDNWADGEGRLGPEDLRTFGIPERAPPQQAQP